MTEAKKPLTPKVKQKPRFKIEDIKPSDIIDVWTLYKQSLSLAPPAYPSMAEEPETFVRSQVFNMISNPNFLGVIARVGDRKSVV